MLYALGYVSTLVWIISMKWELPANSRIRGGRTSGSWNFRLIFFFSIHKTSSDVYREHIISFSLSCLPGIHKSNCFSVASNKIHTWFYSSALNLLPPAFQFACLKKNLPFSFLFGRMGGIIYQQVYILNTGKAFFHVGKSNLASHFEPS